MFSLTLMSKREKRYGLDATVGGLIRIVHPFMVSINAKGGDCWHVYRKSVLFIDGKNKRQRRRREISGGSAIVAVGSLIQRTINRIPDNRWLIISGRTG
jgi:hypothetical protein